MKLQAYKVEYYNDRWKYSGVIQGPEDKVEQLKKQLIHEYEYTEADN